MLTMTMLMAVGGLWSVVRLLLRQRHSVRLIRMGLSAEETSCVLSAERRWTR